MVDSVDIIHSYQWRIKDLCVLVEKSYLEPFMVLHKVEIRRERSMQLNGDESGAG